ncbi:MAG: AAA family ATPase [Pseudomonadota bacterium]
MLYPARMSDSDIEPLSRRESEIAQAYANGASYKEIARDLGVSPATIRTHLATIYRKLGVGTKIGLLQALGADAAAPERAGTAERAGKAERIGGKRLITLVAASLDLDACHDPEDVADAIAAFRGAAEAVYRRVGGQPVESSGADALAAFGVMRAHETDAERALRCALSLRRMIGTELEGDPVLRIAVQTGSAAIAGPLAQALRPLIHAATDLTRAAAPGGLVICPRTRAALRETVDVERIDTRDAFTVAAVSDAQARFEALSGFRLSAFVGRQSEVGALLERHAQAAAGRGAAVLVSGEAGIGKSRLLRQLIAESDTAPEDVAILQCDPDATQQPLHPMAGMIRAQAEGGDLAAAEAVMTAAFEEPQADRAALAQLLAPGSGPAAPADPIWPRLQSMLNRYIAGRAVPGPLVLIVEDAHWADPTTLDWLAALPGTIAELPVLALVTARPEFDWPVRDRALHMLALEKLSAADATQLARSQFGADPPKSVIGDIAARAEGVPLYIEEFAQTHSDLGTDHLPASLAGALAARLDRLGAARDIAQAAAVIGRDFDLAALAAIAPGTEKARQMALAKLVKARIILGDPGKSERCRFRHALIRDAAYDSLLRSDRRALHLALADWLIARKAQGGIGLDDPIARHLTDANAAARAVPYWIMASEARLGAGSGREGAALAQAGLRAATAIEDEAARDDAMLDLLIFLQVGSALGGDLAALIADNERAEALARRLEDPNRLRIVLQSKSYNLSSAGRSAEALAALNESDTLLKADATAPNETIKSHANRARIHMALGQMAEALTAFKAAWSLGDEIHQERNLASHVAASRTWSAFVLGELGRDAEARAALAEAAPSLPQMEGNAQIALWWHIVHARLDALAGDWAAVIARLEPELAPCEAQFGAYLGRLAMSLGPALVAAGRTNTGLDLLARTVTAMEAARFTFLRPLLFAEYAGAQLMLGAAKPAEEIASRGLDEAEATGDAAGRAWCLLRRGAARQLLGGDAAADLAEAQQLALALDLAPLQARATAGLG